MPNRNNPFRLKRYTYPNNSQLPAGSFNNKNAEAESIKINADIPLPNNKENIQDSISRKKEKDSSSIIDFLKEKITIEEIILIGIIFVLLEEGVEDEFLLLLLLYILIF